MNDAHWRMPTFLAVAAAGLSAASRSAVGLQPPTESPTEKTPVLSALPSVPATDSARYETRELAGFTLKVNREFVEKDPALLERVLVQLHADLNEIVHMVPAPAAAALRGVTVWVELQGSRAMGRGGRGLCCHWSPSWLVSNGLPAEKAGGVEVINPKDYLAWRRDQPYMLFHEFAHAYHWQIAGRDEEIKGAYRAAMDKHLYDQVERNSVPAGTTVKAYAASNDHEYFAELSEAHFAVNDFYPYTRAQLRAHDPAGEALMERLWGLNAEEIRAARRDREGAPEKAGSGLSPTP